MSRMKKEEAGKFWANILTFFRRRSELPVYGDVMSERNRDEFATLIYYPSQIIAEMKLKNADLKEWYVVHYIG